MVEAPNRKGEKSLKDAPMPPLPFAHQIVQGGSAEPAKAVKTLTEALQRTKEMRKVVDDIQDRLEEIYRLTGWSPKAVEAYINNPNNFTPSDWEKISKQRKEVIASIMTAQEAQKLEEKILTSSAKLQKLPTDSNLAKERRKKGAGMRRNWLPMR